MSATRSGEQLPLKGVTRDGWSNEDEATSTCSCGAVQMVIPLKSPGLVNTFVCHCSDCRNHSASMFATNVTTLDSHTRYIRGEDNLTLFAQTESITEHRKMTNAFCKTCGTLMWRAGEIAPGTRFMRAGPVDDQALHDAALKPQVEIFSENRAKWVREVEGVEQAVGMGSFGK